MTEHVSFIIGHTTITPTTRSILNHETSVGAMKFNNMSPMSKPDDARCPLLRLVGPHPELAHPRFVVRQC